MKFKKSYLLIISLISILLCISAVSATSNIDNEVISDDSTSDITNEITDKTDTINQKLSASDNDKKGEITTDNNYNKLSDESDKTPNLGVVNEKINTTTESKNVSVKYNDSVKLSVTVKDNESKTINGLTKDNFTVFKDFESEENKVNFTYEDSTITLKDTLNEGLYNFLIKFLGNNNYNPSNTTVNVTIFKINTTISSLNKEINPGEDVILNITVKDKNGAAIVNLTKENFEVYNGTTQLEFNYDNTTSSINITSDLNAGLYNFLIKFLGKDAYNPSNTTTNTTIFSHIIKTNETTIKVNKNDGKVVVPITIENATGNVTFTKEDITLTINYNNKTENITGITVDGSNLVFTVSNNQLNNTKLTINYKENDPSTKTKPVTVNLKPFLNLIIEASQASTEYQTGEFKFKITDSLGNSISNETFKVAYKSQSSSITFQNPFNTNAEGYLILPIDASIFYDFTTYQNILPVGKYNITITSDNNEYVLNKTTYEIEVTKATANIIVEEYNVEVGDNKPYVITVVNAKTGEAINSAAILFTAQLNSGEVQRNITTNSTGQTYLNINLNAGSYPITISSRDSNIDASVVSKTLVIRKKVAVIEASDMTVPYNTGLPLSFTVKDKVTGKALANTIITMSIYTGSEHKDYTVSTNANGQVKLTFLTPLSLGKHKIVLGISDSNYTADSITRYATIKKTSAKFSASKVKTYYNSGKLFTIKVTTTKGKAIYLANMEIRIYINKNRYYKLSGTSNANGLVNVGLNKLKPGTYKVVIIGKDSGYTAKEFTSQIKITKAPVKISPSKFKAKSGKKLKIKVIGKYNKKAVKSLKLKVKVSKGKTSKTYNVKTNKKGFAYIKIKQKPGKYKVVISPNSAYYKAKNTKTTISVKK